jgi:hypothetical protein
MTSWAISYKILFIFLISFDIILILLSCLLHPLIFCYRNAYFCYRNEDWSIKSLSNDCIVGIFIWSKETQKSSALHQQLWYEHSSSKHQTLPTLVSYSNFRSLANKLSMSKILSNFYCCTKFLVYVNLGIYLIYSNFQ